MAKRKLKFLAKVRHKARKTPLVHYAPSFGETKRSVIGTKLSPKERKVVEKEKRKRAKHTHKVLKKAWRKLI